MAVQRQLIPDVERQSRNIHLANLLARESVPTVVYMKTTCGEWAASNGEYTLAEKLKGEHIDFYVSPDLICELGRGLAKLHLALSKIESELQYEDYDFFDEWESYTKPGLVGVPEDIIKNTDAKIFAVYEKLPRCPIHRDIHAENVLFHNGKISGWLDFDLNRKDARIFDIAYLLAGLLVKRFHDPSMLKTWKTIYQNLLDGYNEVSQLTADEIESLPFLMIAIELLFVTYFNSLGNDSERDDAIKLAKWLFYNGGKHDTGKIIS